MADVFFIVLMLWLVICLGTTGVLTYHLYLLGRQHTGPLYRLPVGMWQRRYLSERGPELRAKVFRLIWLILVCGAGGFALLSFLGYLAGVPW